MGQQTDVTLKVKLHLLTAIHHRSQGSGVRATPVTSKPSPRSEEHSNKVSSPNSSLINILFSEREGGRERQRERQEGRDRKRDRTRERERETARDERHTDSQTDRQANR